MNILYPTDKFRGFTAQDYAEHGKWGLRARFWVIVACYRYVGAEKTPNSR